jgi:maleate isomerase
MYGRGGRIGLAILDSDLNIEGDMRRLLPDSVETHTARVIYPKIVSPENMAIAADGLDQAIDSLLAIRPMAIGWACTSGSFFGGANGHRAIIDRMRKRAGSIPVTTASESVVEALHALKLCRPAVGTPYSPEMNRRLGVFLQENRLDPFPVAGLFPDTVDDYTMQDVEEDRVAEFIMSLDRPDCDSIVMSCTGMPTATIAPAIERRVGKPVITSNLAILWNCMRLGDSHGQPRADCALFRTLGAPGDRIPA